MGLGAWKSRASVDQCIVTDLVSVKAFAWVLEEEKDPASASASASPSVQRGYLGAAPTRDDEMTCGCP
jgi:hypothetical protein